MVIQRSDRIMDVLRKDASLIDVLASISPVFLGLRNPLMRKTMGRLATVEQAARVAGMDPDLLTVRLNRARPDDTQAERPPSTARMSGPASTPGSIMSSTSATATPPALAAVPPERIVDLDVREELRNGQEPFSLIMAARRDIPPGGVLRLRAIFEPAPLYVVMAKQGFDHWTEELADDDWRVSFYPARAVSPVSATSGASAEPETTAMTDDSAGHASSSALESAGSPSDGEDAVIVLDVRGMDPPEPMVRTLAALELLPRGKTLLQINERVPHFLLPKLDELGFSYQLREQAEGPVRVFIRRRSDS